MPERWGILLMRFVYCWEEDACMVVHRCRGGEQLSALGSDTAVDDTECESYDLNSYKIQVFVGMSQAVISLNGKKTSLVLMTFCKKLHRRRVHPLGICSVVPDYSSE